MSWLEKKSGWLGKNRQQEKREKPVLTVTQAADILGVDQQTIKRKYLSMDMNDKAPIPFDAWYRLPGGHIRIYEWAVLKIQKNN